MNHEFSIDGLFDFLNAGVSAFHSTAAAAAILEENGYQNCPESAATRRPATAIRPPGGSRNWTAPRIKCLPRRRPRVTAA